MKKQQFMAAYEAPEVEVITLAVEQGFGVSDSKPDTEWEEDGEEL